MSGRDPYLHRSVAILRNKLEILEPAALERVERQLVAQRIRQGVPDGRFGLDHLRAIHRHLFLDIYDWAGEIRTVELSKAGHQFQLCRYIETGIGDIHRRLVEADFLKGLDKRRFAQGAGELIGDLNYVHPFREGNGRTQLQYLKPLGAQAGHRLHLDRLDPLAWLDASRAAHDADYGPMAAEIERIAG